MELLKFQHRLASSERSWPEDYSHENGNYQNNCFKCGGSFIGHKRRIVCRLCDQAAQAEWNSLTFEEQQESLQQTSKLLAEIYSRK